MYDSIMLEEYIMICDCWWKNYKGICRISLFYYNDIRYIIYLIIFVDIGIGFEM